MHLKQKESGRFVLLVPIEDRKALYSAHRHSFGSMENDLDTLLSSSGQQYSRYILYPESPEPDSKSRMPVGILFPGKTYILKVRGIPSVRADLHAAPAKPVLPDDNLPINPLLQF